MATVSCAPRFIPIAERLRLRERYGDINSMYAGALRELQEGQPQNAYSLLIGVLAIHFRTRWVEFSGSDTTKIVEAERLLEKLRSSVTLDKWTYRILAHVVKQPPEAVTLLHADILIAIVDGLVFSKPTKPIRDSRQTEQWLPIPEEIEPACNLATSINAAFLI